MDKNTLKQYRALKNEIAQLEKKMDRLRARAVNVPTVMGRVVGSSRDFPYTEVRTSVLMDEPRESDEIGRLMRIQRERLEKASALVVEIEEFIEGIEDSTDRQIFELTYISGKKQREVAEEVCLERSGISRRIDKYMQNAHKTQK